MSKSVLATSAWWRDLAERLVRQAAQTGLPIIGAIVSAGGTVDAETVAVGLGGAMLLTVVKGLFQSIAGITPGPDEPLIWHLVDRVCPAFFGTLAGLIPATAVNVAYFDWRAALVASVSAALLSVVNLFAAPPSRVPAGKHAAAA